MTGVQTCALPILSSDINNLSGSMATLVDNSVGFLSMSVAQTTYGLSSDLNNLSGSVANTTYGLSSDINNLSSSVATTTYNIEQRASSLENKTGSYATTGSNTFKDNQTITGSLSVKGDVAIDGTLTANELHITYTSSSVEFTSGSTKFGDSLDDTHEVTGSLLVTG